MKNFIIQNKVKLVWGVILLGVVGFGAFWLLTPKAVQTVETQYVEYTVKKANIAVSFANEGKVKGEVLGLNFKNNYLIASVAVKPGDVVVAGQELAKLDDRVLQQQINQANYNYYKAIYERNKIDKYAQPDSYGSAQQQVNVTYTQVQLAKLAYEDVVLKSPIAGTINEVNIFVGTAAQISANVSAITIIPQNALYVQNYLEEYEVQQIAVGTKAAVKFGTDSLNMNLNAEVYYIAPIATYDNTGFATYLVKTKLLGDDLSKIREGYSIETSYKIKEVSDVIAVPSSAIMRENAQTYVFKKTADGNKEKVEVKTGFTNNTLVEVQSGLAIGDIVYTIQNAK